MMEHEDIELEGSGVRDIMGFPEVELCLIL